MKDVTQYVKQILDNSVVNTAFVVKDSGDDKQTSSEIVKEILEHINFIISNTRCAFSDYSWRVSNSETELPISYTSVYFEGDKIVDGKIPKLFINRAERRVREELPDITSSMNAFYSLTIEAYDNSTHVYSSNNEVNIALDSNGYKVEMKPLDSKWLVKDVVDRFSSLDFQDTTSSDRDIVENPRYSTLDYDPKGQKLRKSKDKPDPRFSNLDLNKKLQPEFEALLFQQDQQQDQVQTAQQKLGKQVATQQVSKSVQSQVDKMSYQNAYDAIEEAKKAWDDTDAYDQYTDTIDLASKWYGDNLVLVDSFDIIDKIYYAADLIKKIAKLEDDIANTKSRATSVKLKKELDQLNKDLSNITPQIQSSLHGAKGYDAIENKAEELEEKMEDYIEDYQSNLAEWKALQDKMSKAGKMVEIMEALKSKYADNLDLPPLLYRYKSLMETPIPSLMDVESMETPDLNVLYTAWRKSMNDYRKELQSFNDSFQANYDALSRILALKSKSRSLF